MRQLVWACLLFTIVACDTTSKPAQATVVADAPAAMTAAPAPADARRYAFSQADSKLEFVGAKVTGKHAGSFERFTGTVFVVADDVTRSSVTADIEVASLLADHPKLTTHLKSADLLDVARYPQARFESITVAGQPAEPDRYLVTGHFTLHGVTKTLRFPATIRVLNDRVSVNAEFALARKDFGVVYPGMPDDLIADEVLIRLDLHATALPANSR